jgi:hypothetical protein
MARCGTIQNVWWNGLEGIVGVGYKIILKLMSIDTGARVQRVSRYEHHNKVSASIKCIT